MDSEYSDVLTVTLEFKKNKSDLLNTSITTVLKRLGIFLPYSTCIFRKRKQSLSHFQEIIFETLKNLLSKDFSFILFV